ncbi:MAG TPA: 5-(carboxyamino)imidazole ribonucleotide synthase, partial [Trebonia sp.]
MPVVGMVGGGQLARMTAAAAVGLGATFRVLAESAGESAALVTHDVTVGSHLSLSDILEFAAGCDVITFDHEHVPGPVLADLESAGVLVRPGSGALRYTQDKLAMRERLSALGVPCPRFAPVAGTADVEAFAGGRLPVVLKAVSGGYDGKGVW